MCLTEYQVNYVYTKCNKNGVTGSECVTLLEANDVKLQENDIMYPKNPYECILVNDFEHYTIKRGKCMMVKML